METEQPKSVGVCFHGISILQFTVLRGFAVVGVLGALESMGDRFSLSSSTTWFLSRVITVRMVLCVGASIETLSTGWRNRVLAASYPKSEPGFLMKLVRAQTKPAVSRKDLTVPNAMNRFEAGVH